MTSTRLMFLDTSPTLSIFAFFNSAVPFYPRDLLRHLPILRLTHTAIPSSHHPPLYLLTCDTTIDGWEHFPLTRPVTLTFSFLTEMFYIS